MRRVAAPGADHGLLDPVEEQRAVGQRGQRVVAGQAAHLVGEAEPGERLLAHRGERLEGLAGRASTEARARLTAGATSHIVPSPARTRAPISFGTRAVVAQVGATGWRPRPGRCRAAPSRASAGRLDDLRLGGGVEERLEPSAVLAAPGQRPGRDQDREHAGPRAARSAHGRQLRGRPARRGSRGCRWRRRPRGRAAPLPWRSSAAHRRLGPPARSTRPRPRSRRRRRRRSPAPTATQLARRRCASRALTARITAAAHAAGQDRRGRC